MLRSDAIKLAVMILDNAARELAQIDATPAELDLIHAAKDKCYELTYDLMLMQKP